ncbi:MAG: hypothetical protein C0518_13365 [Opitutus sp.]|nr:hypothetical protein [Opitutus sp.]
MALALHPSTDLPGRARHVWHGAGRGLRVLVIVLAVLFGLILLARLVLPFLLQRAINARLEAIPEYSGSVESVEVALLRGAYALNHVIIRKRNALQGEPFFAADRIDFSLAWRELLRRRVVSDIVVTRGRLNFLKEPAEEFSQLDADRRWQDAIQDIFPIDITYFEINDGTLHYVDRAAEPVAVDVFVKNMHAIVTGLRNRPADEQGAPLPADLLLEGDSVGGGRLLILGRGEPLAAQPHFELRVTLERVNLPDLNELLRAYGNVDVSRGVLDLYFEMAARDGRFEGYMKPFLTDLDFRDLAGDDKNLAEKIWEKIVSGVVGLFKNKPRDQLGARVPFAGEFGDAQVGLLATLRTMFRHGFIRPLPEQLERSVKAEEIEPPGESPKPPKEPKQD